MTVLARSKEQRLPHVAQLHEGRGLVGHREGQLRVRRADVLDRPAHRLHRSRGPFMITKNLVFKKKEHHILVRSRTFA